MKWTGNTALKQLALTSLRELIRDRATFFFVLIFPFLFMFMFMFIASSGQNLRYQVGLVMPPDADQAVAALAQSFRQVSVLDVKEITPRERDELLQKGSLKVAVNLPTTLETGAIRVASASDGTTQAALIAAVLRDITRPPGGPVIESAVTAQAMNAVEFGLPAVLILAFFSLATMGTMGPIIQMRERGALRLLGLTPLPRSTFILAHLLARFALGLCQLAVILGIAFALHKLPIGKLPGIIGVSVLGLLMLFALGYALAGLVPSVEVANGLGGGMMPVILMFCGVMMPFEVLPPWVIQVAKFIPVTYLGDAMRYFILGSQPLFPIWMSVLVISGSTIVLGVAATFTFRWDRRDERKSKVKRATA